MDTSKTITQEEINNIPLVDDDPQREYLFE